MTEATRPLTDTDAAVTPAPLAASPATPDQIASARVVVLTGMSGAGKQLASRVFEDMGWRVVDNLPPRLLPALIQERLERESQQEMGRPSPAAAGKMEVPGEPPLCLVCDVRGQRIEDLPSILDDLEAAARRTGTPAPTLLFLDTSDEELIHRFKETRRTHPLFLSEGGIFPAIARERALLTPLRARAALSLDTTGMPPSELRARLMDAFGPEADNRLPLTVTVASFGFKHGSPLDADLLFDVRFLRNPHYVEELRPKDGRDPDVEAYVMADERAPCLLDKLCDLVSWTLPHYVAEGKAYLTIGIGCTGGRHRSVVLAEKLGTFIGDLGYRVLVQHRDTGKGSR